MDSRARGKNKYSSVVSVLSNSIHPKPKIAIQKHYSTSDRKRLGHAKMVHVEFSGTLPSFEVEDLPPNEDATERIERRWADPVSATKPPPWKSSMHRPSPAIYPSSDAALHIASTAALGKSLSNIESRISAYEKNQEQFISPKFICNVLNHPYNDRFIRHDSSEVLYVRDDDSYDPAKYEDCESQKARAQRIPDREDMTRYQPPEYEDSESQKARVNRIHDREDMTRYQAAKYKDSESQRTRANGIQDHEDMTRYQAAKYEDCESQKARVKRIREEITQWKQRRQEQYACEVEEVEEEEEDGSWQTVETTVTKHSRVSIGRQTGSGPLQYDRSSSHSALSLCLQRRSSSALYPLDDYLSVTVPESVAYNRSLGCTPLDAESMDQVQRLLLQAQLQMGEMDSDISMSSSFGPGNSDIDLSQWKIRQLVDERLRNFNKRAAEISTPCPLPSKDTKKPVESSVFVLTNKALATEKSPSVKQNGGPNPREESNIQSDKSIPMNVEKTPDIITEKHYESKKPTMTKTLLKPTPIECYCGGSEDQIQDQPVISYFSNTCVVEVTSMRNPINEDEERLKKMTIQELPTLTIKRECSIQVGPSIDLPVPGKCQCNELSNNVNMALLDYTHHGCEANCDCNRHYHQQPVAPVFHHQHGVYLQEPSGQSVEAVARKRTCLPFCEDENDKSDAVQEVVEKIASKLESLDNRSNVQSKHVSNILQLLLDEKVTAAKTYSNQSSKSDKNHQQHGKANSNQASNRPEQKVETQNRSPASKTYSNQDSKMYSNQPLRSDTNQPLKSDSNQPLKSDSNQPLKSDSNQASKSDTTQPSKANSNQASNRLEQKVEAQNRSSIDNRPPWNDRISSSMPGRNSQNELTSSGNLLKGNSREIATKKFSPTKQYSGNCTHSKCKGKCIRCTNNITGKKRSLQENVNRKVENSKLRAKKTEEERNAFLKLCADLEGECTPAYNSLARQCEEIFSPTDSMIRADVVGSWQPNSQSTLGIFEMANQMRHATKNFTAQQVSNIKYNNTSGRPTLNQRDGGTFQTYARVPRPSGAPAVSHPVAAKRTNCPSPQKALRCLCPTAPGMTKLPPNQTNGIPAKRPVQEINQNKDKLRAEEENADCERATSSLDYVDSEKQPTFLQKLGGNCNKSNSKCPSLPTNERQNSLEQRRDRLVHELVNSSPPLPRNKPKTPCINNAGIQEVEKEDLEADQCSNNSEPESTQINPQATEQMDQGTSICGLRNLTSQSTQINPQATEQMDQSTSINGLCNVTAQSTQINRNDPDMPRYQIEKYTSVSGLLTTVTCSSETNQLAIDQVDTQTPVSGLSWTCECSHPVPCILEQILEQSEGEMSDSDPCPCASTLPESPRQNSEDLLDQIQTPVVNSEQSSKPSCKCNHPSSCSLEQIPQESDKIACASGVKPPCRCTNANQEELQVSGSDTTSPSPSPPFTVDARSSELMLPKKSELNMSTCKCNDATSSDLGKVAAMAEGTSDCCRCYNSNPFGLELPSSSPSFNVILDDRQEAEPKPSSPGSDAYTSDDVTPDECQETEPKPSSPGSDSYPSDDFTPDDWQEVKPMPSTSRPSPTGSSNNPQDIAGTNNHGQEQTVSNARTPQQEVGATICAPQSVRRESLDRSRPSKSRSASITKKVPMAVTTDGRKTKPERPPLITLPPQRKLSTTNRSTSIDPQDQTLLAKKSEKKTAANTLSNRGTERKEVPDRIKFKNTKSTSIKPQEPDMLNNLVTKKTNEPSSNSNNSSYLPNSDLISETESDAGCSEKKHGCECSHKGSVYSKYEDVDDDEELDTSPSLETLSSISSGEIRYWSQIQPHNTGGLGNEEPWSGQKKASYRCCSCSNTNISSGEVVYDTSRGNTSSFGEVNLYGINSFSSGEVPRKEDIDALLAESSDEEEDSWTQMNLSSK